MTQRDSLISEFFSNTKSEREIKTFSGQFPSPSELSGCPRSPSPAPASLAGSTCPVSRTRTSLSQLHLSRANVNPRPNIKTFSTKNLTISSTSVKMWAEETESASQFAKGRDRNSISSTSSKTVKFSRMPTAGLRVLSNEGRGPSYKRGCSARSPPTKQSLKFTSFSSSSTSSSQTSGLQEC